MLSFLRKLLSRPAADDVALPSELPLLAVREGVLFPWAISPYDFGRARSMALLDSADSLPGGFVALFAQIDPMTEEPDIADLHTVGAAARIVERKRQNAGYRVMLHGYCRIRALRIERTEPYLVATTEALYDSASALPPDRALVSQVRELAKRAATFHLESARRTHEQIDAIPAPSALADFVGANVDASVAEKARLLATLDPSRRLEEARVLLAREVERLEAGGPPRDGLEPGDAPMAWSQEG